MSHECKCIERLIRNNQVDSEAFEVDSNVRSRGASGWWTFRDFNPAPEILPTIDSGSLLPIGHREGEESASAMFLIPAALACRRELIDDGRTRLGRILPVEFRTDGRFSLRTYRAVREKKSGYVSRQSTIDLELAACGRRAQALASDHRGQGRLRALGLSCRLRKDSDVVVYGANSGWHTISILGHNDSRIELDIHRTLGRHRSPR